MYVLSRSIRRVLYLQEQEWGCLSGRNLILFFPSAVGCPIVAPWPHLRQGPAISALPPENTEDTTRGTTQDATYSEASLQNRFLTLVSGLSLAGTFGILEATKEDEHDT